MTTYKAERYIIAQDPLLPGLALLLDNTALLTALRQLPALKEAQSVTVTYLRYKPKNSCAASLSVKLSSQQRIIYFAKALTTQRFSQSWLHPKRQSLIAAGDPDAPLALPDSAILLQHPLYDRSLRSLHWLKNNDRCQTLFRQLLPTFTEPGHIDWRFLRYKPERRIVILLSHRDKPIAVLRCACAKIYGQMLQGTAVGASLGHISLLGSVGKLRMLATSWIAGDSLEPKPGRGIDLKAMTETGATLAQLHNTPFTLPMLRSNNENIQALWRVLNTFAIIYPQGTVTFRTLATQIGQYLMTSPVYPVIIHGDFSADQVIKPAEGGVLKIIDWDRCSYGSPLIDIGSFQARLELQVIQNIIPPQQASAIMAAFLSGYSSSCPHLRVDKLSLAWYVAWALLCLATEPFRIRDPHWPAQIDALLNRVQQLIAQSISAISLPTEKVLTQLITPSIISTPLLEALKLPALSQLRDSQIIRHKPGKRAIIEYKITMPDSQLPYFFLGKYCKKGVNRDAFNYQQCLWQHGWDNKASFCVPEPLALLPTWNTWLQRKVDAHVLTKRLIPGTPLLADLGQQVGRALAALHQHRMLRQAVMAKTWSIFDELAVLQSGLEKVAALYPHWQTRLSQLLTACEKLSLSLNNEKETCIHRDFYPDQVLVNNSQSLQLTLIDFDLCCISSPALDAGNYLAHIREQAIRQHGNIDALKVHEQAFIHAFLADSPEVNPVSIESYTTLALVRHIFLSTQFTYRRHTTTTLIDLCEKMLQLPL